MVEHIIYDSWDDTSEDPDGLFFIDECDNLNKELDGRILAIADLGLWNGRHDGYKILGKNLNEVMYAGNYDFIKIFSDGLDICKTSAHHDGTNHYVFREIREDRNIDNLTTMIYNGEYVSRQKLNYYTKSLVKYVNNIYGW